MIVLSQPKLVYLQAPLYPLPGRPSLREMDETKPLLTGPSPVAPIEQPPPYEEPVAPGMTIKNKYIGSVLEL